jgi:tellurite resistance protein
MPTIYTTVEVDVDLDEFDTDDLIEELENRGHSFNEDQNNQNVELIEKIYLLRRNGKCFDRELDQLIYDVIGRIV